MTTLPGHHSVPRVCLWTVVILMVVITGSAWAQTGEFPPHRTPTQSQVASNAKLSKSKSVTKPATRKAQADRSPAPVYIVIVMPVPIGTAQETVYRAPSLMTKQRRVSGFAPAANCMMPNQMKNFATVGSTQEFGQLQSTFYEGSALRSQETSRPIRYYGQSFAPSGSAAGRSIQNRSKRRLQVNPTWNHDLLRATNGGRWLP